MQIANTDQDVFSSVWGILRSAHGVYSVERWDWDAPRSVPDPRRRSDTLDASALTNPRALHSARCAAADRIQAGLRSDVPRRRLGVARGRGEVPSVAHRTTRDGTPGRRDQNGTGPWHVAFHRSLSRRDRPAAIFASRLRCAARRGNRRHAFPARAVLISAAGTRSAGFPTIAAIWAGRRATTATWAEAFPEFRSGGVSQDVWTPLQGCPSVMYNRMDKSLTAFSRPECSARHVRQRRTARRRARGHRSRPAHGADERRTSPDHADLEKDVRLRAPTEYHHIDPCPKAKS